MKKRFLNYFFTGVFKKGYLRLILVGSFILPLIVGLVLYFESGEKREYYGGEGIVYDDNQFFTGLFFGILCYWVIYFLSIWVYQGFKEDKLQK